MKLLSVNNLIVQRLSGKPPSTDASSAPPLTSKRAKVRFFSRHIPKLFIKGNEVCLVRLLPS